MLRNEKRNILQSVKKLKTELKTIIKFCPLCGQELSLMDKYKGGHVGHTLVCPNCKEIFSIIVHKKM